MYLSIHSRTTQPNIHVHIHVYIYMFDILYRHIEEWLGRHLCQTPGIEVLHKLCHGGPRPGSRAQGQGFGEAAQSLATIHTYIYIYIYVYICIYTYMYIDVYRCIERCIFQGMYILTNTYTCINVHTYIHIPSFTYFQKYKENSDMDKQVHTRVGVYVWGKRNVNVKKSWSC